MTAPLLTTSAGLTHTRETVGAYVALTKPRNQSAVAVGANV